MGPSSSYSLAKKHWVLPGLMQEEAMQKYQCIPMLPNVISLRRSVLGSTVGGAVRWQLRPPFVAFFGLIQGFVEVDQETQRFLSVWMFVAELGDGCLACNSKWHHSDFSSGTSRSSSSNQLRTMKIWFVLKSLLITNSIPLGCTSY